MVANELAEDDSQLEVRIIRTKGGIRNVAYIAENENELIVHKKTTIAEVPEPDPNIAKNNQNLKENFHDLEISKSRLNKQNLLKEFSPQSAGYQHSKFFNNKVSPLTNSAVQLEVEAPKVNAIHEHSHVITMISRYSLSHFVRTFFASSYFYFI